MCGLLYFKSFKNEPVVTDLIKRYEAQKRRGTEGFGVFFPNLKEVFRATTEDIMLNTLAGHTDQTEALFHHRMPTSTDNTTDTTHPFSTGRMFKHNYVLAHNGVIYNDTALKEVHEKQGITYSTVQPDGRFNDSEALLWEMAMWLEGKTEAPATQGGAAFIVIEQDLAKTSARPRKVHFGRNDSNPLYMQFSEDGLVLASEHDTWDDAESIMPNYLYTYNYRTKALSIKPMKLETYSSRSYSNRRGEFVPGHGWVNYESRQSTLPSSIVHAPHTPRTAEEAQNVLDDDFWDAVDAGSQDDANASQKAPVKARKTPTLLGGEELERAADNLLVDYLDKYEDVEHVEERLSADIKRSRQAVEQLGTQMQDNKLKPKSVRKYYKYLQYLQLCVRAMAMLTLIVDDEMMEKNVKEVLDAA